MFLIQQNIVVQSGLGLPDRNADPRGADWPGKKRGAAAKSRALPTSRALQDYFAGGWLSILIWPSALRSVGRSFWPTGNLFSWRTRAMISAVSCRLNEPGASAGIVE